MKPQLRIYSLCFLLLFGTGRLFAQTWEWAVNESGTYWEEGRGVAVDPSGNVFVTGYFQLQDMTVNTVNGPVLLSNQGKEDVFLIKYDAQGNALWARSFGGNLGELGNRVAADDQGNVYVTGDFRSAMLDFGNNQILTNTGMTDAFLVKYDPNGNVLWARSVTGNKAETSNDVVVTDCGVAIIGSQQSTISAVGGTFLFNFAPGNTRNVYVASFTDAGGLIWARRYGGAKDDVGYGLAYGYGRLFATGVYTNTISFGPYTLTGNSGNIDGFVAALNCASGATVYWAQTLGGSQADFFVDVTVGNGRVFIAGEPSSTSITVPGLGVTTLSNINQRTPVIVAYGLAGNPLWIDKATFPVGGLGNWTHAVEADNNGSVYLVGNFYSPSITFGTQTLNGNTSYTNFYMVKYNVNGNIDWVEYVPPIANTGPFGGLVPNDVAIDTCNYPVVTGALCKTAAFSNGVDLYSSNYPNTLRDVFTAQMGPPQVVLTASATGPFCAGTPGLIDLTATPSGGIVVWNCPTAQNALATSVTSNVHNNTFDLSLAGPGTHCIIVGRVDNLASCPTFDTLCIDIYPQPGIIGQLPPPLCMGDPPIDLAPFFSPPGGTFTGSGVTGTFFDPTGLPPGTYPVTYSITDPTTNCSNSTTFDITIDEGRWHQYSDPQGGDIAQDVVTDSDGNVYVTGFFRGSTVIRDNFGTTYPISTAIIGMYVAKYTDCGRLEWVNHTSTSVVRGLGVTVDETTDMVYVVGSIQGDAQFEDFCGVNGQTLAGLAGYVAQYDRNTGCLLFAENVVTGLLPVPSEVTSWAGNLYITGRENSTINQTYNVFTHKYTPVSNLGISNSLGGPVWTNVSQNTASSPYHIGRDIAMDLSVPGAERVVITGDFQKALFFPNNPNLPLFTPAETDAFFVAMKEFNGTTNEVGQAGAGPMPGGAHGRGIAVDPNGNIFVSGDYHDTDLLNPFGTASPVPGGNAENRTYVAGFGPGITGWANYVEAPGGNAFNSGVAVDIGRVVFAGDFTTDIPAFAGGPALPYVGSSNFPLTYSGSLEAATGNYVWANATRAVPLAAAYGHYSTGVTTGINDRYFLTGYYRGEMDYLADISYTGILPAPATPAMYVLRGQTPAGTYYRTGAETAAESLSAGSDFSLKLWPNPGSGIFRYSFEGLQADTPFHVRVTDIFGKLHLSEVGITGPESFELDLSDLSAGVYFLRVEAGSRSQSVRIIKQ